MSLLHVMFPRGWPGWCLLLGLGVRTFAAPVLFEEVPDGAPQLRGLAVGGVGSGWWRMAPGLRPSTWRPGDRWTVPSGIAPNSTAQPVTLLVDEVRAATGDPGSGLACVRAHPEGDPGAEVFLVLDGQTAAATWRARSGEMARIVPDRAGLLRWTRLSGDAGPDCANPAASALALPPRGALRPPAGAHGHATADATIHPGIAPPTTNILDIAFFFTPAAQAGAGGARGMAALVELSVWEANDAYTRSGALILLRPVASRLAVYVESGDLASDLSRLVQKDDGHLDEIHRIRDEVAADVVCLVAESEAANRYAGMANAMQSLDQETISQGFVACVRPYLVGNYTLPHEVAHVLGCAHDRENAGGAGLQSWSYGTRIMVEGRQYRTVMAYRPGLQFPHFSNPSVSYRGVPTGVAVGPEAADNVRTLRFTAPLMSQVRSAASRMGFETRLLHVAESAGVIRIPVVREGILPEASCRVTALDGSAVNGTDFSILWENVRFATNQARQMASIAIRDNDRVDGSRRLTLLIETPSTGSALGPFATLDLVITDDESDAVAPLDTGFRPVPGADLGVHALAGDGLVNLYAGGAFVTINGAGHRRVARLGPDGAADGSFRPEVKYQVNALAVLPNQQLVIGGEFNTVNGGKQNHVALLTPAGGLDPGFEFEAGTDYPVHAILAQPDGNFVVAGAFTTVQGLSAFRVARLLPTGGPDPSFSRRFGPDGDVHALQRDAAGRIYMGGRFGSVAGRARPGVDRLNPDGTPDAGFGADGTADAAVRALALDEQERLWVGGDFTHFLGFPAAHIARLTSGGRVDSGFIVGAGANHAILAMAPAGDGRMWVAGQFTEIQGQRRIRVARLLPDGTLDPSFDPGLGPNDSVHALLPTSRGTLVLGGLFTEVNGVPRGGLAALLPSVPPRPQFGPMGRSGPLLTWEAAVAPRQIYSLEASADLRGWTEAAEIGSAEGTVRGETQPGPESTAFFRLRRKLQ